MTNLFITVLNMSLTASYVALVIIIVRMSLKKAPRIFSYFLWTVVMFRLICPVSIGLLIPNNTNIAISNTNGLNNITAGSTPQIYTGSTNIQNIKPSSNGIILSINNGKSIMDGLAVIWLLGIIALVFYSAFSYLRLKRRLSVATLVNNNTFETDRINVAFVLGFIKPKIYIPTGLKEDEKSYILEHERTHIRRKDHIIKPLIFIVTVIHWFNPLIWLCYYLIAEDIEMSCDESVIKRSGSDIRISYSNSLLSLSARMSGFLAPLSFGENNVKYRIKNILSYRKPEIKRIVVAFIIVAVVGTCLIISPRVSINTAYAAADAVESNTVSQAAESKTSIPAVSNGSAESGKSIVYENNQYGFDFTLPKNWDGYKILTGLWQGRDTNTGEVSQKGAELTIRNPLWTAKDPYQDIPVMIFTSAQWDSLQNEDFSVSAAPFGPSELGRNSKYVFAIPPRYNYANLTGWEEAEVILNSKPLQATESFGGN